VALGGFMPLLNLYLLAIGAEQLWFRPEKNKPWVFYGDWELDLEVAPINKHRGAQFEVQNHVSYNGCLILHEVINHLGLEHKWFERGGIERESPWRVDPNELQREPFNHSCCDRVREVFAGYCYIDGWAGNIILIILHQIRIF